MKYLKEIKKFIGSHVEYDTYGGGFLWGKDRGGLQMIAQVEDVDETPPQINYDNEVIEERAIRFIEQNNTTKSSQETGMLVGYIEGFKACQQEKDNPVVSIRGWGAIQGMFKTYKECLDFQDELGKFIADAINEKLNGK